MCNTQYGDSTTTGSNQTSSVHTSSPLHNPYAHRCSRLFGLWHATAAFLLCLCAYGIVGPSQTEAHFCRVPRKPASIPPCLACVSCLVVLQRVILCLKRLPEQMLRQACPIRAHSAHLLPAVASKETRPFDLAYTDLWLSRAEGVQHYKSS